MVTAYCGESLTAEPANAFAIVHYRPLVHHDDGLRQAVAQTGEATVESLLVASLSLGEFWGANGSHFDIHGEFAKTPLLC